MRFSVESTCSIDVYVYMTGKCQCKLSVDGSEYNLINVNNNYFFTYKSLTFIEISKIHGHVNMNSIALCMYHTLMWSSNISNLPTYAWFKKIVRRAILGFETLNHPNPLQKGVLLKCPHSGCNTIIADGTQIGVSMKKLIGHHYFEPKNMIPNGIRKMVSSRVHRRMIENKKARDYFGRISKLKHKYGQDFEDEKKEDLKKEEYDELKSLIKTPLEKKIISFIDACIDKNSISIPSSQNHIRVFCAELAIEYQSITSFLQLNSCSKRQFIARISSSSKSILDDLELLAILRDTSPLLYDVYCQLDVKTEAIFKEVILAMYKLFISAILRITTGSLKKTQLQIRINSKA